MQFSDTKLAEGNFYLGTTCYVSKSQVKGITVLEKSLEKVCNSGFINLNELCKKEPNFN